MDPVTILWILGVWGLLVICAILNGIFRESVLVSHIAPNAAHVISSITLSTIILLVSYLFLLLTSVEYSEADLWLVGLIWVVLTIAFEFGFGHYVVKKSWSTLLADYNIFKGRIWFLVLIVTLTAPYIMGSLV